MDTRQISEIKKDHIKKESEEVIAYQIILKFKIRTSEKLNIILGKIATNYC